MDELFYDSRWMIMRLKSTFRRTNPAVVYSVTFLVFGSLIYFYSLELNLLFFTLLMIFLVVLWIWAPSDESLMDTSYLNYNTYQETQPLRGQVDTPPPYHSLVVDLHKVPPPPYDQIPAASDRTTQTSVRDADFVRVDMCPVHHHATQYAANHNPITNGSDYKREGEQIRGMPNAALSFGNGT